jgi:aminoglycoside phosphotransferase
VRSVTARSRAQGPVHDWLAGVRWRLAGTVRDLTARFGVLDHLQRLRGLREDRRRAVRAYAVVPAILAKLADVRAELQPGTWQTHDLLHTESDVAIVTIGPTGQPYQALIKIAETKAAADGLDWQRRTLITLRDDERLGDWRTLLPHVLDAGETAGTAYLVEQRLTGTSLTHALTHPAAQHAALRSAADAVGRLHSATASDATVGEEILERWVNAPTRALGEITGRSRGQRSALTALDRLADDLRAILDDQPITLSWVHGDYAPNNILSGPDGEVSGIVDWEFGHPEDFPSLDVVTLLLTARMSVRRQELGRVVCDLLADPTWTPGEAEIVAAARDARARSAIGNETIVVLCWLRHVASMLTRCTRYADNGLWMHANVYAVLNSIPPSSRDQLHAMSRGPVAR